MLRLGVLLCVLLVGCASTPPVKQTAVAMRISTADDYRVVPARVNITCSNMDPEELGPMFRTAEKAPTGACYIDVVCFKPDLPVLDCDREWCIAYCAVQPQEVESF